MSNTITIELCKEDRARVDALIDRLDGVGGLLLTLLDGKRTTAPADDLTAQLKATLDKAKNDPAEAPKNAAGATKTTTAPTDHPVEGTATWETPAPSAEAKKPPVTLEQIQKKCVELSNAGGAKKAKMREIVKAHAAKVSDLPADKWDEVWAELTALEKED
jgi:hypothetical protein